MTITRTAFAAPPEAGEAGIFAYCPYCGAPAEEGFAFCRRCGKKLPK